MRTKILQAILLASVAPMLAACGTGGLAGGKAPYADLYMASYAERGKTVRSVLSVPGKTIEGAAIASKQFFGENDNVGQPAGKLILEYLGTGSSAANTSNRIISAAEPVFKMTYNGLSIVFTEDDIRDEDFDLYFEKVGLSGDDQERTIAYLYSLDGGLDEGDRVMIPVGFGVRLKRDGTLGTADSASQFVDGFSIIGLETNPATMPKDRTAQYDGRAKFELRAKQQTDGIGVDRIRYDGDSEIAANFSTGKITGKVIMDEQVVQDYDRDEVRTDLEESGAEIALSGDIVSNGFTLGLAANEAAVDVLADVGITDLAATGAGRFYGTNAEAVAALVTGSSTNFLLNGVIWGYEDD